MNIPPLETIYAHNDRVPATIFRKNLTIYLAFIFIHHYIYLKITTNKLYSAHQSYTSLFEVRILTSSFFYTMSSL